MHGDDNILNVKEQNKLKNKIKISALYDEAPCLVVLNFVKKTKTNEDRTSLPAVFSDSVYYCVVSPHPILFCLQLMQLLVPIDVVVHFHDRSSKLVI